MVISKDQAPPVGGMGGSIHGWERGLDPWHIDAIKYLEADVVMPSCGVCSIAQIKQEFSKGKRQEGWFGIDGAGNLICWIPDGTEM